MVRIAIITAVYQRPELTSIVLGWYMNLKLKLLKDNIDLGLFAVGSEGEISKKMCVNNGFKYIEAPNKPLNRKFNKAVELARKWNPDGVMLVGSDDVIDINLIKYYANKIKEKGGIDSIYGAIDAYIFHVASDKLVCFEGYRKMNPPTRAKEPVGGGRFFGKNVLEKLNWNLWDNNIELNCNLDGNCTKRILEHGFNFKIFSLYKINALILAIKHGKNITPFKLFNLCKPIPKHNDFLIKHLGKRWYNKITKLSDSSYIETNKPIQTIKEVTNPLINILIRTSNRPNYFKNCTECVKMQTYKNVNLIISADDDFTENYVKNEGYNCLRLNAIPKSGINHSPYNYYLNTMMQEVKQGFVIFLDDDDYFVNKNALQTIVNKIYTNDDLITWEIENSEASIIKPNGFCFNIKYKKHAQWRDRDNWNAKIYQQLTKRIPRIHYINETLVKMGNNGAKGNRIDIEF